MILIVASRATRGSLSILMAMLCWLALAHVAHAQTDDQVYTDALVNGWQNWSWATVNLANTTPVQSGGDSISVSAGPYQALYLHQTAFDSSIYTNLGFWINGGSSGGQLLQVQATLNGTAQTVVNLPALAANTWQQVTIPLSSLGVANQPDMDGFWIQDRSGTTQPTFYIDTITVAAAPAPSVVNVTVNAADTLRVVDARHFGINTAVWDALLDTSVTSNLLTEMGAGSLRFPGGSLSDDYHWATNTTDSNTWTWATSFDQFAQVATTIGAKVFVTADYGSGTPTEAAAWVTESNLTNHYGFKYWEIGNEEYGSWETDNNTVAHDPYTYAQRFQQYYTQMKAVDPTIKIGAVSVPGEDSYANNTNHPVVNPRTGVTHNGWTPVMLATMSSLGVTPDFLIYHRYPQSPGGESDQGLLLSNGTWSSDAADLRQQLEDYLGSSAAAGVELDNTENNSVSSGPGKQTTSLVNGLFLADSICAAMNTEFNAVTWWDLRNGQETGNNNSATLYGWRQYGDYGVVDSTDPPGPADTYPTFYVEKLLQYFARDGDQLVSASSDYPFLSVCAAQRASGGLTLLVVNKSASNALNANISISRASLGGSGMLYSYSIPQDDAAETGVGSADLAISPITGLGTSFSHSFSAYSANVIAFGASGPSPTATATTVATPTATRTATATASASRTATATATASATHTATATTTPTAARTATVTATETSTSTATLTPTATITKTALPTATATSTRSPTTTATFTPTATATASVTASATRTSTPTASATGSTTASATGTGTPTATFSASPTSTFTATATATRTASATSTITATASATATATTTATASSTPTDTATGTVTPTGTATRTATPTATPTPVAVGKVKPGSLSFQKRAVGTRSSAKTVSLKNIGTAALTLSSVSATAGFIETNQCSSPLKPGKSCTISVKFAPTVTGVIDGSLTINDNAQNTPQIVTLGGTGSPAK